jgi:MTH538 TIR-like domain (DUF1863)
VGAVVDPLARRGDPLPGGDRRSVANNRHEITMSSRPGPQHKLWYRRRALRIFRDDTSLSATPSLWPSIEHALGQSRFLILLASPEAATSPWVRKEIAFWLEHKSADTRRIEPRRRAYAARRSSELKCSPNL